MARARSDDRARRNRVREARAGLHCARLRACCPRPAPSTSRPTPCSGACRRRPLRDQRFTSYELAPHTRYEIRDGGTSFTTGAGPDNSPPVEPGLALVSITLADSPDAGRKPVVDPPRREHDGRRRRDRPPHVRRRARRGHVLHDARRALGLRSGNHADRGPGARHPSPRSTSPATHRSRRRSRPRRSSIATTSRAATSMCAAAPASASSCSRRSCSRSA